MKVAEEKLKLFVVGADPCWTDPKQIYQTTNSKWILDESGVKIFVDHMLVEGLSCPDENKYAWIYEPASVIPDFVDHIKSNVHLYAKTYNKLFTHNRQIANLHDNFVLVDPGFPSWINSPKIHKKSKVASMITSTKNFTPGHRHRIHWANKLHGQLDLYGRGHNEIESKEDGLNDYMFSVSLENDDTVYTEKLLDCFLTGTVPIYWGSDDVKNIFNNDGIIWIDSNFSVDSLTEELYNSKKEAIQENFEIAKQVNKGIPEMVDFFVDDYILGDINE